MERQPASDPRVEQRRREIEAAQGRVRSLREQVASLQGETWCRVADAFATEAVLVNGFNLRMRGAAKDVPLPREPAGRKQMLQRLLHIARTENDPAVKENVQDLLMFLRIPHV